MPLEKCAYKIEKSKGRNLVSRMYAGFHSDVNPAIFVCFFHLMQVFTTSCNMRCFFRWRWYSDFTVFNKKAYHVAQKLCSICRNGEIYPEKHGLIRSSANLIRSSMNFMFVKGFML